MEDSHRYGITKLTDDNYHIWQQRTELWLRKEDIWDVIGDAIPGTPDSAWYKRDRQARATIGLLIDDRFLPDIKHEKTAWGTWDKLQKIHSHNTLGSRLILYRKIFSARYSPGTNIVSHITGILEDASKLEDAGYKLLDELVCSALMGSLPREYDTLITTIEGRSSGDITVDYVREKIIEENRKKEKQHNPAHNDTKALFTQSRPKPNRSKTPLKCFYCQKVGHIRRDCRLLKKHNVHSEFTRRPTTEKIDQTRMMSSLNKPDAKINRPVNHEDNYCVTSQYRALSTGTTTRKIDTSHWIIDTGAAEHMTRDLDNLHKVKETPAHTTVVTASGETHEVTQLGDYILYLTDTQEKKQEIILKNVLHVPELTESLISIAKLDEAGYTIKFDNKESWLHKNGTDMLLGKLQGSLYLHEPPPKAAMEQTHLCRHVWHDRLGHRNIEDINHMKKENMADGLEIRSCDQSGLCTPCILSKMTNAPFPTNKNKQATQPFQIIYSDLCGPISPESLGHNAYILTFTDEFSKFSTTYMLRHKHETTDKVIDYVEKGISKFGHRPQIFFSDGGGEYMNGELQKYLSKRGIKHLNSLPYTPQENGQAERYNRTLLETTRTLLKQSKLPDYLWAEITSTATYLLNLVGRQNLKSTPYELWHGQRPKVNHLRTIGSTCYFLNTNPHKGKLEDRSIQGTLVGYGESNSFYRIWETNSGKIYQSRKVVFQEDRCPYINMEKNPTPSMEAEKIVLENTTQETVEENTPEATPRRSSRSNLGKPPVILTYDQLGTASPSTQDWYNRNFNSGKSNIT